MARDNGARPEGGDLDAAQEMGSMPDEPLLPIEKKLIAFSLVLGALLLGVLVWASYTFFPPTP